MESLDFWRLCEELSLAQAALLIVGEDPTHISDSVERLTTDRRPVGYDAARTFLVHGLRSGNLEGQLWPMEDEQYGVMEGSVDVHRSWVAVASLKERLAKRGMTTGFFFPDGAVGADYLDPMHDRYAPKLAAAVRAWQATKEAALVRGKSPKQALVKWLRQNATAYGLSDEDGKPNETGIEEVAKVANWRLTGGAPKTPKE